MSSLLEQETPPTEPSSDRPAGGPAWMRRSAPIAVVVLLAQMVVAMMLGASNDSPVFDETTHIGAGIMNVRDHDLRWNAEHPPLVKAIAGVATLGERIEIPKDIPAYRDGHEFDMARAILYESGNDPHRIVWRARLAMIALTALFGLVVFGFARDLFGTAGGVLALAVFTLCPTILAHGRVVHTDVAVYGFLLATAWFLYRSERGALWWTAAAGVAFGLALASKFSALFALPPVALVSFWGGYRIRGEGLANRVLRGAGRTLLTLGIALVLLWGTYLAVSPGLRFETSFYDVWASRTGGLTGEVIDRLPVPEAYRVGLRFATAFDQAERRRAFLNGDPYTGGRAIFYPAVIAMKTPLGTLVVWTIGLAIIVFVRRRWDGVRALLPIPLTILGIAILSSTNIGIRHVAAVPLFGAVAAGSILLVRRGFVPALVLTAFVAASVWRAFPADLSYTNEAFGGPSKAHERLADSNADWGQDLFRLRDYIRAHPDRAPAWILYFGTAVPAAYGIDARDATKARAEDVHGLVAVSTSWIDLFPDRYGWVTERGTPGELVGTTILLYTIP